MRAYFRSCCSRVARATRLPTLVISSDAACLAVFKLFVEQHVVFPPGRLFPAFTPDSNGKRKIEAAIEGNSYPRTLACALHLLQLPSTSGFHSPSDTLQSHAGTGVVGPNWRRPVYRPRPTLTFGPNPMPVGRLLFFVQSEGPLERL